MRNKTKASARQTNKFHLSAQDEVKKIARLKAKRKAKES